MAVGNVRILDSAVSAIDYLGYYTTDLLTRLHTCCCDAVMQCCLLYSTYRIAEVLLASQVLLVSLTSVNA